MRPLVVTTFLTLDGVAQAPGGPEEDTSGGFPHGGWLVPHFDEVMAGQMDAWFATAQDFLLGRRTYEIFAAHWPKMPTEGDRIAWSLNALPKHVASRTLESVDWDGARLIEGDVADAVRALKAEDGGELQVHGSLGLVQTLLAEDLVDELRLIVFPVVLGTGRRLFAEGAVPRTWRLTASTASSTGALLVSYTGAGEVQTGSFALDQS
ncbi:MULTISPECIES: dihydrofolate reductase family protein [unclassified Modestobacter]|uniref:dihydrofolate reductase family protein n=1 Tax=unclassified Modestobacter TaxID=2643866 RepID=UPI0022AAA9F1|nr:MULTISPECIES: dihydrofolate reductase family protein [unclassified Modestobacter]MCZ2822831.1 dihydrofolate reductase family protein [Modestobacter sp. VKM Ac-2981]MCZ2851077.1 dihydrofolate reductase family protein [Modestobacter sp. VKM Ac-2982]